MSDQPADSDSAFDPDEPSEPAPPIDDGRRTDGDGRGDDGKRANDWRRTDGGGRVDPDGASDPDDVDDLPRVSCERCGREWTLDYELEELAVGNQAVEQFALDHQRHTGHFPDGVATHRAVCRRCPESVQRLSDDAARRWAEVHARHTRHAVELRHSGSVDEPTVVGPDDA